jgi:outer membrane protein assembly factor BamB
VVHAIDFANGKPRWSVTLYEGVPKTPRHLKNTYASETPVTDGERVYAHFGDLGTYCLDLQGKQLCSKRWPAYPTRYGWGTASSPALHQGQLYIVNDNDEGSFLLALDKKTGKEIWRVERDEKSNWATPYIWENERRTEIITCGTNRARSYDLDGKLLWEFAGMSSIVIPTPFSAHGLLYVTSGYVGDETRPVFAVRPGASGDITLKAGQNESESIAWFLPQAGPYNPSPLVYEEYYYTLFDRGFLTCHEAKTGKQIYDKQRFEAGAGAFTACPWAYNGKVFCLSEDGDTFVVQAGPEYKLLGKNSVGEMCMATPAIARGSLILRTRSRLYRISNES